DQTRRVNWERMNSFLEVPRVFTNKCVERKVERVVRWLAVALEGGSTRRKSRTLPADIPRPRRLAWASSSEKSIHLRNVCYLRRPNEYPRWVLPPPIPRRLLIPDSDSNNAVYKYGKFSSFNRGIFWPM